MWEMALGSEEHDCDHVRAELGKTHGVDHVMVARNRILRLLTPNPTLWGIPLWAGSGGKEAGRSLLSFL